MTWLTDLLDRLGEPVPCELCRTPTPATELTECRVPGAVIPEWGIVVDRVVWVCPRCPVIDPPTATL
jgi:hypothetical protein